MDYSRYLVLYSGGADSTYFIEREPTAKYLIHYRGLNDIQTRVAAINSNLLNRYMEIEPLRIPSMRDGETNQIHALYDTEMALTACIRAAHHGMKGIVMCFTADDIGIDIEALLSIMHRVELEFEILLPLKTCPTIKFAQHFQHLANLNILVACIQKTVAFVQNASKKIKS